MNSVAFTGYRPEKMPFEENMQDENYLSFREELCKVINHLIECGYTHFLSGVATGFDTWVAEAVLELQKENKDLHLECVIPCPDQDKKWEQTDKDRRQMILELADQSTLVSEHYSRDCFFARNRYMVDKSDVVVCAYDGQKGGTAYTVKYALRQNKIVIQINPSTLEVSTISNRMLDN